MITALWLAWVGLASATTCDLNAPADAPFALAAPVDARRVHLIIEVHVTEGQLDEVRATLQALADRGLAGTLVLPVADPVPTPVAELASWARAGGHRVAVRLARAQIPTDPTTGARSLRASLKAVRKAAGRISVAVSAPEGRSQEAILGRAGLPTLLMTNAAATGVPRLAGAFEGMPVVGVALPAGPYAGPCGTSPTARPFTPLAADRVTQALHGAAAATGDTFVRLALAGEPGDAAVLGRWLDTVVLPAGIQVVEPEVARDIARALFRTGLPRDYDPRATPAGRLVGVAEVKLAAEQLVSTRPLPREVAGLSLAEAFQAFTLLLAERAEGDVVRLRPLTGPSAAARTASNSRQAIPRDAAIQLARDLAADNPAAVPTALPVAGQLLSATEVLVLFASCVRGDDPCEVEPVTPPEPNAPGLGWGASTAP